MLYGRTLLQKVPEETTALLIDLCAGTLDKTVAGRESTTQAVNGTGGSGTAVLSYLGYSRVAGMFTSDSQGTTEAKDKEQKSVENSGSKLSTSSGKGKGANGDVGVNGSSAPLSDEPSYIPPSPRQYFAHFADHHDLFIHFLEAVALTLWGQQVDLSKDVDAPQQVAPPSYEENAEYDDGKEDQRAVWNTLLELYLTSTQSTSSEVSSLARRKALGLLVSELPYDIMHALLLCSTADFTDGTVRLWERSGMYEDVLRYYMGTGIEADGEKVIRALDLYGAEHPNLYPLVLRWITSSPEVLSKRGGELPRLLAEIDERRIMSPLTVVQVLSRNGVASVGNVKEWLRGKVAETKQDIESVSLLPF